MKIGLLCCFYNCAKDLERVIAPWLEYGENDPHKFQISVVHGLFKEYAQNGVIDNDFDTQQILKNASWWDFLYLQNNYTHINDKYKYQTEAEIRTSGLKYLLEKQCDYIWLLDGDEFYTVEQIKKIIIYISQEDNKFITWFSIPMRNYIFSGHEYIEGFCPPRIFKVMSNYVEPFKIQELYWDNDMIYKSFISNREVQYKYFPHKSIPKNLISGGIKHMTWLHTNSKLKYEYQMKHFGHCGYKWNYETNQLELNLEYYRENNIPLPEIFKDEI